MNGKIKFSNIANTMSILFMLDQALLPMFHPFGIPLKISYIFLIIVPLIAIFSRCDIYAIAINRRRLWNMVSPIIGIALIGLLGQCYLMTLGDILDPFEAIKQFIVFILMVLAFSLGQRVPQFPIYNVVWIFYCAIAIILFLDRKSVV